MTTRTITPTQVSYLEALRAASADSVAPPTLAEVAALVDRNQTTVRRALKRLERLGLVVGHGEGWHRRYVPANLCPCCGRSLK